MWKYLRKTITSTTENNLYQEHRRLEEKLFKLQFVDKKELHCIKKHLADELLIRLHFFLSHVGL
jgi:hypothetical protein